MRGLASNPKAYHDYFILKEYLAGISLKGAEVKSAKLGKLSIKGSYVRNIKGELYVVGMHISKYMSEGEDLRDRKLLLNRKEINEIIEELEKKGLTVVPLEALSKDGLVKLKIGIGRGKKNYDKRETLKKKSQERDAEIVLKQKVRF